MNIRIITTNPILTKGIQESITGVQLEFVADEAGLELVDHDVLVVDNSIVSADMLRNAMSKIRSSKVLYIVDQAVKSGHKANILGVTVVVNDGRVISIVEEIKQTLRGLTVYKNVLTFWSPISGAGTTTTALTILRNIPDSYRTLYLSLTDVPGIEYIKGGAESSIADIFTRLLSGVLDIQELVSACKSIGNKFYLGGLNSFVDVALYTTENIKALITMASTYFDYIFVDAGFGASIMAIAAFSVSAHIYVVTTTSAIAAIRYEQLYRQVYGNIPEIKAERCRLVTNMEDRDMLVTGRTAKTYGLQPVGSIRVVETALGIRAGYEESLIYDLDASSGYRKDVDSLTTIIFNDIGVLQADAKRKERRTLFGWGKR